MTLGSTMGEQLDTPPEKAISRKNQRIPRYPYYPDPLGIQFLFTLHPVSNLEPDQENWFPEFVCSRCASIQVSSAV